ncbi:MAG TPA: COR domain-containing protein, partial [Chitinophagales bacterium]|nr:COR domain-containing protein [Chitinophagales bacterium]
LEGNKKLGNPPPEIVSQGLEAMLRHWERLQKSATKKLNEAKLLIVGEARVGKTSLLTKLLNPTNALPAEEHSTRGIDVHDYTFTYNDETYTIHFWDFGGQQIYRSTHNLFLTNRSFYLLVDDSSRDDTRLDYWLQKIERLAGPETPTFLVQNQRHNRQKQIDENGLWGKFSQLRHAEKPYKLDLTFKEQEDKDTREKLKSKIEYEIANMPIVGTALPENWVRVREQLAAREKESAFMSQQDLHTLCAKHNITQYEELKDLSQLFHDLGVFLHFHEDAVLKHLVILQKEWATDAIYFVLDDPIIANNNKGRFCKTDVIRIWTESDKKQQQTHPNHASYQNHIDELIALMVKFELCYERQDQAGEYIIPQMLPVSTPIYDWGEGEEIQLYYDYGAFMPEGILHRLIVRTHQYITNLNEAWARGCILYDTESATTKAEIIEPYAENRITLRAKGSQAKTLLSFTARQLDSINRSYGKDGLNP